MRNELERKFQEYQEENKKPKKKKKGLKLTGFPALCDIWTHKEVSYIQYTQILFISYT